MVEPGNGIKKARMDIPGHDLKKVKLRQIMQRPKRRIPDLLVWIMGKNKQQSSPLRRREFSPPCRRSESDIESSGRSNFPCRR